MEVIKVSDKNIIHKTAEVLKLGGLVIFPTETCYGVAVDATNQAAVSKLLKYKKRPEGKAISVAVSSKKMAEEYVELNSSAKNIYKQFLPGPVTVISKSKNKVDKRLQSEKDTLGIRIPDYRVILKIIEELGSPITSTSANPAGKNNPYSISQLESVWGKKHKELVDLIIDAGELPKNLTSTVIDTTTDELKTHRKGKLDFSQKNIIQIFVSKSVGETINFAQNIYKNLIDIKKPVIFLLRGELGAGKTHFTKGIAKALNIERTIKSPTYTYVDEYKIPNTNGRLYHIDAWRIENKDDLSSFNLPSWVKNQNILVIEWPDIVLNLIGEKVFENTELLNVEIEDLGENNRKITIWK